MFLRCSVSANKADYKEKMLQQDRYEKMNQDISAAHQRKEEKMRLYADKYNLNSGNQTNMM